MTKNPRARSSHPQFVPGSSTDLPPATYEPMAELSQRPVKRSNSRANDRRWWIIIGGWLLFGALTSLLLLIAIAGESPHLLFAFGLVLIIYGIPLLRGTLTKLERQRPPK
jgi:hypothetical protein